MSTTNPALNCLRSLRCTFFALAVLSALFVLRSILVDRYRRSHRTAAAPKRRTASPGQEIAEGVFWLPIHGSNVYLVQSGSTWVLIDTAWGNCSQTIRDAAESLFGADSRPAAILLTHDHPDHVGAALELAQFWSCPVYVHPAELALTIATDLATIEQYANPMDRWIILPIMRALPQRWVRSMISKGSLERVVKPLTPGGEVPALPEWTWIPTPGHSPGHVAFFRERDRVLITGDALLTVDLASFGGWLSLRTRGGKPRTTVSPWYTNWDQRAAEKSADALLALHPSVIASGHGTPMGLVATESECDSLTTPVIN
jgi:glyoxylase-like metal-dependent hydrolase (beta-lactamase superfamily II)